MTRFEGVAPELWRSSGIVLPLAFGELLRGRRGARFAAAAAAAGEERRGEGGEREQGDQSSSHRPRNYKPA